MSSISFNVMLMLPSFALVFAVLASRAAWRGQGYTGLLIASCLAGVPYLLRD